MGMYFVKEASFEFSFNKEPFNFMIVKVNDSGRPKVDYTCASLSSFLIQNVDNTSDIKRVSGFELIHMFDEIVTSTITENADGEHYYGVCVMQEEDWFLAKSLNFKCRKGLKSVITDKIVYNILNTQLSYFSNQEVIQEKYEYNYKSGIIYRRDDDYWKNFIFCFAPSYIRAFLKRGLSLVLDEKVLCWLVATDTVYIFDIEDKALFSKTLIKLTGKG